MPLKLYNKQNDEILWQNPRPSSSWYCRPIKFRFTKETTELIQLEINSINDEVQNLKSFSTSNIEVEYTMILTMVDNKVCNAAMGTSSSMRCYICNAKPKEMNNLDLVNRKSCNSDNYSCGMSTLHAWIRTFEFLLHVAYNIPFKKWAANTAELKQLKRARKEKIQKLFREKTGLLVDFVKQGWSSSNDGNTARRFFANAELSAEITEIDVKLIKRFHTILQVISSPHRINATKFQQYTFQTAKYCVEKYGWYYMPASVHKLLIHGADIVQNALLPIGQLSEEAQESRHKDLKKYRAQSSTKMSRIVTNEDVFDKLLLTSDPYMSTLRIKSSNKKHKKLDPEAAELIMT